jgi:hypothetical protein
MIKKTTQLRSGLGLALGGLMIISLTGMTGLAVLMDELVERGWAVPSGLQVAAAQRAAWQKNTGNEISGEATAWLFGLSSVPVLINLISRTILRFAPVRETGKSFIRQINTVQKKYLMPLHTWLSIPALGLGILHLTLSSCAANPLPELGLILSGTLVTSGLLFKWKAIPASLRKTLYQFHASLIVSGVLLAILFIGHAVMSSD